MRPLSLLAICLLPFSAAGCMTAMNSAARRGDIAAMQKQLDAGHAVDEPQQGGYNGGLTPRSPLMIAAVHGRRDMVRFLLSKGADVNYRDPEGGSTPLMSATWGKDLETMKLLVEAGADPNARDRDGQTALDMAREYQLPFAVIQYLERVTATTSAAPAAPVTTAPSLAPAAAQPSLRPGFRSAPRNEDLAVIIGVERYADLPPALHAERDAEAFKRFALALGVPERNIMLLTGSRATKTGFEKTFEAWLPNNATEASRVLVYFSGHGSPDPASGDAYLLPSDGDPQYLAQSGYPLKRLYSQLGRLKTRRVLVALDSCFSGAGGRSVLPKGTRPLVNRVDTTAGLPEGLTVLSAAAADQISGTDDASEHGLFTVNLLEGLNGGAADSQGKVTARSLFQYLSPRVQDAARRANRQQAPQFIGPAADLELR